MCAWGGDDGCVHFEGIHLQKETHSECHCLTRGQPEPQVAGGSHAGISGLTCAARRAARRAARSARGARRPSDGFIRRGRVGEEVGEDPTFELWQPCSGWGVSVS